MKYKLLLLAAFIIASCQKEDVAEVIEPIPAVEPVVGTPANGYYRITSKIDRSGSSEINPTTSGIVYTSNGKVVKSFYIYNGCISIPTLYRKASSVVDGSNAEDFDGIVKFQTGWSGTLWVGEKIDDSELCYTLDTEDPFYAHIIGFYNSQYDRVMNQEQFDSAVYVDAGAESGIQPLTFNRINTNIEVWSKTPITIDDVSLNDEYLEIYEIVEDSFEDTDMEQYIGKRYIVRARKKKHNMTPLDIPYEIKVYGNEYPGRFVGKLPAWINSLNNSIFDMIENPSNENAVEWIISEAADRGVDISDLRNTYSVSTITEGPSRAALCSKGKIYMYDGWYESNGIFSWSGLETFAHEIGHAYFNYQHPLIDPNGCDSSWTRDEGIICADNVAEGYGGGHQDIMGYGSIDPEKFSGALDRFISGENHKIKSCGSSKSITIIQ